MLDLLRAKLASVGLADLHGKHALVMIKLARALNMLHVGVNLDIISSIFFLSRRMLSELSVTSCRKGEMSVTH